MITYLYKNRNDTEVQTLDEARRNCWVYAEAPSEDEVAQLASQFSLEPGNLEDALDEDEQPRLEREGARSYVYVRFAYKKSSGEIDTAPMLFVFGGEQIITVTRTHVPAVDAFMRGRLDAATTQPAKLILLVLSHMSDQYDMFINQTSRQIKSVRARLRGRGITNKELIDFVTIEDELNEFLASLQPTNAALRRLLVGRHLKLGDEDEDIVQDLLLNNEQSIEACKSNLTSISNIRDSYSAISANNLNRTIELLTIATVVLAVPNLIYALFGTNVKVPFENQAGGFYLVLVVSIIPVIVLAIVARKKRII